MRTALEGKNIVLGVTGSIAAYKALDAASKLTQAGALVDVILTASAEKFITRLSFQSITHRQVYTDLFDSSSDLAIHHVALAERADLIAIYPATANTLAKLAHGIADDTLSTTVLASRAPLLVAPAMDGYMYNNPATQANINLLEQRDIHIIGPSSGHLASGLTGTGRLVEPTALIEEIKVILGRQGDLTHLSIVVSAGGTQEPIDPVRVITNHSSGKMGYAIAEAARDRGAKVTLVTASKGIPDPAVHTVTKVTTVNEMRNAVLAACEDANVVIMAAAISDYTPVTVATQKIKKDTESDRMSIEVRKTNDFFLEIPPQVLRVGFAAESEHLVTNAAEKLERKGMALIVANDITAADSGFNVDTNRVTFVDKTGMSEELPLLTKYEVGHKILDKVQSLLHDSG
ncbi:MAG: bifunctional phosphopantothenoylcysteine decarboxylase/phosphopantothenate--cysteine ligase CoaBC [Chloroflexi bacterium]|nr:bifunctional phosphopantothenoylcysteine decarboxylase/phosphopantothenate--cysteine ligase CoaBC [Chloroflexota bacterium]